MDMFTVSKNKIKETAQRHYLKAIENHGPITDVMTSSGLWSSVRLLDGTWLNVYEWMVK